MVAAIVRFLKLFERLIVTSLIFMMVVVVLLSTIELGRILVVDIITPPNLLDITDLLDVFGFFMLILIGVELLETIRAYLNDHQIHVEIVLEVALIAVARKIVILDIKEYSADMILAIAAMVLSLAGAYYLQKRARNRYGADVAIKEPVTPPTSKEI